MIWPRSRLLFQFTPPRRGRQQIHTKANAFICANWRTKARKSTFLQVPEPRFMQSVYYSLRSMQKWIRFSAPTYRKIMGEGGRRKAAYNNSGSPVCTGPVFPMVSIRFL